MDWNKAIEYAQLVNAAYDDFAGRAPVTPGYDVAATLYANDLATDRNPNRGKSRVKLGLILKAQAGGEFVVAIRGTEGIKEWVQDAHFGDVPFKEVPGAGCTEDGFTAMYRSMTVGDGPGRPSVVKFLGTLPEASALTICGHSLGGAIATLLALDIGVHAPALFNDPTLYTYASPRTGNHDFVVKYHQTITTTYRFVDNVDLVPKLPGIFPYRHVTDAIKMDSLTLIPPRVKLQPNPVCWHILTSYIYLMSLESGASEIPPEATCAPGAEVAVRDILDEVEAQLSDDEKIKDKFTASLRTSMGGNT
jgi:hypothetical protein